MGVLLSSYRKILASDGGDLGKQENAKHMYAYVRGLRAHDRCSPVLLIFCAGQTPVCPASHSSFLLFCMTASI